MKDYQKTGAVCGIQLPEGLVNSSKLPETIFTPSTKAEIGDHDENISFEQCEKLIGAEDAAAIRDLTIKVYETAASHAKERGIIIADTKFEFGVYDGKIILGDEVLTPDLQGWRRAAQLRQAVRAQLAQRQLGSYWQPAASARRYHQEDQ